MTALTVDEVLSYGKQISHIGGIALVVWRVVIFLHQTKESIVKTFNAIPVFMEGTTKSLGEIHSNVSTAVNNHLSHMEDGIGKLADSTDRLANSFEKHVKDMTATQAIILDRLPQV